MSDDSDTDTLAIPGGLEPPTRRLEGGCSIQLSYGTAIRCGWRARPRGACLRSSYRGEPAVAKANFLR